MLNSRFHGCRHLEFEAEGNRFLSLENEKIKATFWLNKGADLIELRHKQKDVDVMWHTPLPMPAAGNYIPPVPGAIGSFFDYYPGGWQEVFPNNHLPTSDYKNAPLGLHGEVCLLPWQYRMVCNKPEQVTVELEVRTARTPFRLVKQVTLRSGEQTLEMQEWVQNEGEETMDYNWSHHPVFGEPFLEEGCRIELPEGSIAVTGPTSLSGTERYALDQRSNWPHLIAQQGEKATVDASHVLSKKNRSTDSFHLEVPEGRVALFNPRLNLAVKLEWDLSCFPYLWCWQGYGGSMGYPFYGRNYNVALEPFSTPVQTLPESIQTGHAHHLEPGERRETWINVSLITKQEEECAS